VTGGFVKLRLIWLIAISVAGCNRPADYALVGSAYVPAAQGDIEVEKVDKGQILLTFEVDQLLAPDRIEPSLTHYVVWFAPVGEDPTRQGVLQYDPAARVGRASFVTSWREFEVRITAESTDTPSQPSDFVVASQDIREN
jgi:hypothetical protein